MKTQALDPLPKPKGAIAALFVGMLYPNGPQALRLATYPPKLIDTAKLDLLSPAWLRVGQPKASASGRDALVSARLADLVSSFARHHAQEAIDELGIADVGRIVVKRLPSSGLHGQIGLCCALRLEGARLLFDDEGLPEPKAIASVWAKIFLDKMRSALARRGGSSAEWSSVPEGTAGAALRWAMELGASEQDEKRLAAWGAALLGFEESREIQRSVGVKRARRRAVGKERGKGRL